MVLVDLFSGCGGFSLGARRAGFRVAAAFDNDPILSSSYERNFPGAKLIQADVAKLTGSDLKAAAKAEIVGVFGGPPCQGFSDIGRRRPEDPRRELLGHFFRLVDETRPGFFVMENVRGLAYADARHVLDDALRLVRDRYAIFGPTILDAADFGAATRRPRLFVVGIQNDRGTALSIEDLSPLRRAAATVRDAISDLRDAVRLEDDDGFDVWRIGRPGRPSAYAGALRAPGGLFTGHRPTVHTPVVTARFAKLREGEIEAVGRHPRLSWDGQCPTLRAGTGSDRGSYQSVRPIHPEEHRVITVREAARLQGFPDGHRFHPTVWHSFRMIGNSVSPPIAEAIFSAVKAKLKIAKPLPIAAE